MAKKQENKGEQEKSQEVKTIEAIGSTFYCQAELVSKAIKDFGVAQLLSADGKDKWLLFKIANKEGSCMRMGDVFMLDVPNISEKYDAREKLAKEQQANQGEGEKK